MRLSPGANKLQIRDYAFNRHGSPLPDDVFVLPLYDEPPSGTPVVLLALVKLKWAAAYFAGAAPSSAYVWISFIVLSVQSYIASDTFLTVS